MIGILSGMSLCAVFHELVWACCGCSNKEATLRDRDGGTSDEGAGDRKLCVIDGYGV